MIKTPFTGALCVLPSWQLWSGCKPKNWLCVCTLYLEAVALLTSRPIIKSVMVPNTYAAIWNIFKNVFILYIFHTFSEIMGFFFERGRLIRTFHSIRPLTDVFELMNYLTSFTYIMYVQTGSKHLTVYSQFVHTQLQLQNTHLHSHVIFRYYSFIVFICPVVLLFDVALELLPSKHYIWWIFQITG